MTVHCSAIRDMNICTDLDCRIGQMVPGFRGARVMLGKELY